MPGVLALSTAALLLFAGVIGCMAAAQTSVFLQGLVIIITRKIVNDNNNIMLLRITSMMMRMIIMMC
jgi:ABC-type multidrug transport system permease subunit